LNRHSAERIQVILQDAEYKEMQRAADAQRVSIAAGVRQALSAARRREPLSNIGRKLAAVRAATRHSYPMADINDMLAEIERGDGVADYR
jgi:hypothetical protein